ncbi:MAG: rod-binding protein [Parasphingorhabdus sp.]
MTSISPQTNLVGSVPPKSTEQPRVETKNAAEKMAADFEAIFARQMLSAMRTSSLGEGLFDGQGMEQFRDMQDTMLAENMADKGIFGIANLLTSHVVNNAEKTDV